LICYDEVPNIQNSKHIKNKSITTEIVLCWDNFNSISSHSNCAMFVWF